MTNRQLIFQSIKHYWKQHLMLVFGVAVSTAVLTGALIVGDSVKYSLQRIVQLRLGDISHTISAGDRFFTEALAIRMENTLKKPVAPLILTEGMASGSGGRYQVPRIQVVGIDQNFFKVTGFTQKALSAGRALIGQNLAQRLNLKVNDELILRIKKLSVVPLNAPFVSEREMVTPVTVRVGGILSFEEMGRFDLKNIQTAPLNVFLSLDFLNEVMGAQGKVNYALISSGETSNITSALNNVSTPEDLNLNVQFNPGRGKWDISSERVFIDPAIQKTLISAPFMAEPVLTYFVNKCTFADRQTPYSFVSTISDHELKANEIIINSWLAEDLQAKPGDTITLDYFVMGPLRELTERSASFKVNKIVPLSGKWIDEALMPSIPGLSDVGDCQDWETGVPIDLEKIRTKDEDYWDSYRGAPKAFLSYEVARQLWANRFGESTLLRIASENVSSTNFQQEISRRIHPDALGFKVNDIRNQADRSAAGGVDFGQLFLGLSFFLLLAGILLTYLLFNLYVRTRMDQIGTLSFLGFTQRKVKNMFLIEGLVVSIAGSLIGVGLAMTYNLALFNALNTIWSDIVRTQILEIDLKVLTLMTGLSISLLISVLAILFSLKHLFQKTTHQLQRHTLSASRKWVSVVEISMAVLSAAIAIGIVIWSSIQSGSPPTSLFFISGTLLLLSILLFVYRWLHPQKMKQDLSPLRPFQMIKRNINHNARQSFLVISMFALGTFIIISTGSFRQDLWSNAQKTTSGTGGFLFYGESTVPILHNLNDPEVRFLAGLEKDYQVVQCRQHPGDDASCLNLNRTQTPGILGVDPLTLTDRFQFVNHDRDLGSNAFWSLLENELGDHIVPAIADQSVIQWGLGMKVGDTLDYLNEQGETMHLKLIAGLANSIFQGHILIADHHFLEHFPSSSGANIFLIEGVLEDRESISNELQNGFRDHGLFLQETAERLAMFSSVQNTYLSIFLILGGLGLLIGTFGLVVVVVRNLLYRKQEIGIMQATGFTRQLVMSLITKEYVYLLIIGVGAGLICALLATLPSWVNPNMAMSPIAILIILGFIIINGIFWIIVITQRFLRGNKLLESLRSY
jgi:ABC-type lipoprotein release transport system permease subunit